MKRIMALMLAGAMLLALGGCRDTGPKPEDPGFTMPPVTPGQSSTGQEGLEVRVESLTWSEEEGTVLVIIWDNGSDKDVIFGSAYAIERLEGEEWVSCAKGEDPVFDSLGYELKAGQSRKESYDLTDIYEVSMPGSYRFRADCYVMDGEDKGVRCELTAEFTVAGNDTPDISVEAGSQVPYCARYFRTAPEGELNAPGIWIIGSLQDLRDHHNIYHERLGWEVMPCAAGDRSASDVCGEYDGEFFEENYLVFLYLGEGSSSVRHEVRGVERTGSGKLAVAVDRKVPEFCTDDLTRWHIILEMSRDVMVESPADVILYLNGKALSGSDTVVLPTPDTVFRRPPAGALVTPGGESALRSGAKSA